MAEGMVREEGGCWQDHAAGPAGTCSLGTSRDCWPTATQQLCPREGIQCHQEMLFCLLGAIPSTGHHEVIPPTPVVAPGLLSAQTAPGGHGTRCATLPCPRAEALSLVPPISMESSAGASRAPRAAGDTRVPLLVFCPSPCDRQSHSPVPRALQPQGPATTSCCHPAIVLAGKGGCPDNPSLRGKATTPSCGLCQLLPVGYQEAADGCRGQGLSRTADDPVAEPWLTGKLHPASAGKEDVEVLGV